MGKLFQIHVGGNFKPSGDVSNEIKRGHTGRSVLVGPDYNRAKEWSECGELDQILFHPAAGRFRDELKSMPVATAKLNCVRGRLDDTQITSWQNMGPPPRPSAGRYNASDEVVLYLCDSDIGVSRELPVKSAMTIFLQDYSLDTDAFRVADLSASNLSEFVKAIFDFAESSNVEGRIGPSDYSFSQVVARLVKEAGFDGMIVPGVRGDSNHRYRNVVLFDVVERWIAWSHREDGFRHIIVP